MNKIPQILDNTIGMNNQQRSFNHMSFGNDFQPLNASDIFGTMSSSIQFPSSSSQEQKAAPRFSMNGLVGDPSSSSLLHGNHLSNGLSGQFNTHSMSSAFQNNLIHQDLPEDKRKFFQQEDDSFGLSLLPSAKKQRLMTTQDHHPAPATGPTPVNFELKLQEEDDPSAPPSVPASNHGQSDFDDNDVLSGRGGGTNVHPGNRNFRDLINLHRRAYLKARKNDKPGISKAIVRAIRESGGKFLKKNDKDHLWYEIGDAAAREKTSQALRQRAPEMRKLLFDAEREEAQQRASQEQQLQLQQHQRLLSSNSNSNNIGSTSNTNAHILDDLAQTSSSSSHHGNNMNSMDHHTTQMHSSILQAMANQKQMMNETGGGGQQQLIGNNAQDFSQMFSAALLSGGINRFGPNGA